MGWESDRTNSQNRRRDQMDCSSVQGAVLISGCIVILIVAISLIAVSIKKLPSTEYGIQYNVHKKQLSNTVVNGGLHNGPPGFVFIQFPSTYISATLPEGTTCLSQDGLRVNLSASYQFQIPREWVPLAVAKYRDFEQWQQVVVAAGGSAVQHSCSLFTITNFENMRGIIQSTMEEMLRFKLEGGVAGAGIMNGTITMATNSSGVYARAVGFQLTNIGIPDTYQQAVQAKQQAEEDIALAENERLQATTMAQTTLLAATEQARTILDTAANDANITLTEAQFQANAIVLALESEAQVIRQVRQLLNLTTADGVLSFLANRLVQGAAQLEVTTAEPASLSRKSKL